VIQIMSLPLRRSFRHGDEEPAGMLPAPGPSPAAQPPRRCVVIFVIVVVMVAWLLGHRYSAGSAFGIVSGAGALATAIASWLAGVQPAAR
jgi:hypothetical protein